MYAAYARAYAEIRQGMLGIRPKKAPFKKENCFFEIFVPKSDEIPKCSLNLQGGLVL